MQCRIVGQLPQRWSVRPGRSGVIAILERRPRLIEERIAWSVSDCAGGAADGLIGCE